MNPKSELLAIIDNLLAKKRFRHTRSSKLHLMFDRSELHFDEKDFSPEEELVRFRKELTVTALNKRIAWWKFKLSPFGLMIPSFAILLIMISVTLKNFQQPGNTGKGIIENLTGRVSVFRNDKQFNPDNGSSLSQGDIINTDEKSNIQFSVGNNSIIKIIEGSSVSISRIIDSSDGKVLNLSITRGGMLLIIKKLAINDSIEIKTPSSMATVRGTVFGINLNDKKETLFEVYDGKIQVKRTIPDEISIKDKMLKNKLDMYFSENAVIIEKNNAYRIPLDEKTLHSINIHNFNEHVKELKQPGIVVISDSNFLMKNEILDFIKTAQKKDESSRPYLSLVAKSFTASSTLEMPDPLFNDWKNRVRASFIEFIPELNLLINISEFGLIEATDLSKLKWSNKITGRLTTGPVIIGKKILLTNSEQMLYCIDAMTGRILWGRGIEGAPNGHIWLIKEGNTVYAATANGSLYKIGINGEMLWKSTLSNEISSPPLPGKDMVFVSIKNGIIIGLDKTNGIKIIKHKFNSPIISMTLSGNHIFAASLYGVLYCYNPQRDEVQWRFNIAVKSIYNIYTYDEHVYIFNTDGKITKLNTNGLLIWKIDLGNAISKKPVFDEKNLIIATDRTMFIIDKKNGGISWSVVIPNIVSKNITVNKNSVYFISDTKGITVLKK